MCGVGVGVCMAVYSGLQAEPWGGGGDGGILEKIKYCLSLPTE